MCSPDQSEAVTKPEAAARPRLLSTAQGYAAGMTSQQVLNCEQIRRLGVPYGSGKASETPL
jgi:hypothetical protein